MAVLAEKPSVARDIAKVLGANTKGDGYMHGNGYVVTWAIGHLASLAQPHEIRPEWKTWRRDSLPMLPSSWPLVVYEKTKDQFEVVQKDSVFAACEPHHLCDGRRARRRADLPLHLRGGGMLEADRPVVDLVAHAGGHPQGLRCGEAGRSITNRWPMRHADAAVPTGWLGMNLSRAYTLTYGDELSVGRVQTPTLAMVVERELAVRRFVPEDYLEVVATFRPTGRPEAESYKGTWVRDVADIQKSARLPASARKVASKRRRSWRARKPDAAAIESVKAETQRMGPPPLYDLTELQRHANRLFGFSAQHTLDTAQALYERHKLISYPRTDSRHLVAGCSEDFAAHCADGVGSVSGTAGSRHRREAAGTQVCG